MDYIIIAAIIAIVLICGMVGRKKGLVKIVLSMVATIVSVCISSILTTPVCEALKDKLGLMDKLKEIVAESLKNVEIKDISYVEDLELPDLIKDKIVNGISEIEIPIKDYVIESIASVALSAIVFIVIFIISSVIVGVIVSMADIIAKLPIVRQANRGAGFVVGLIYGILVVWIAMIMLTAMSGTAWANDILFTIGNNEILSYIYDANPVMGILANIIERI